MSGPVPELGGRALLGAEDLELDAEEGGLLELGPEEDDRLELGPEDGGLLELGPEDGLALGAEGPTPGLSRLGGRGGRSLFLSAPIERGAKTIVRSRLMIWLGRDSILAISVRAAATRSMTLYPLSGRRNARR